MSDIPEPQAAVAPITRAAIFIVFNIADDPAALDTVRDYFGDAAGLVRSVGQRSAGGHLSCVVGIGSDAWDRLFGSPRPALLHTLAERRGSKHFAPSTPGDLLLHIRAERMDLCFELAMHITTRLGNAVEAVDEVHGFRYFDARTMLGFVDGTENPEGQERFDSVVIGDEDPGFSGGSYVIVQKYLHDMKAWKDIGVDEQERVIGRTKLDDIEMPDDIKPSNSHIALNVIEDEDGNELSIVRHNMAFGQPGNGDYGTYFIGYARDPAVTETMLDNMFIGNPPGNYDRILDFSTAVTGTLFFVPSAPLLEALADGNPVAEETASAQPHAASGAGDGSLNIGSLKGLSE